MRISFLSPLRGFPSIYVPAHGLRRGLHSFAASRLSPVESIHNFAASRLPPVESILTYDLNQPNKSSFARPDSRWRLSPHKHQDSTKTKTSNSYSHRSSTGDKYCSW